MSRLSRLYPRLSKVGQSNRPVFKDPSEEAVYEDQLQEAFGIPVPDGIPEEVGNRRILPIGVGYADWEQNFGVHNDYVAKCEVDGTLWILSNDPWNEYYLSSAYVEQDSATNPEEYEEFDGLEYAVQPTYQIDQLDNGLLRVLHSMLAEETVPYKIIDNLPIDDNISAIIRNIQSNTSDMFTMPNVLVASRSADVNIIDEIDDPEGLELTEVTTYPGGEQPQKQTLFNPTKQRLSPSDVLRGRQSQLRDQDLVRMDEVNENWGLPEGKPDDVSDQSNVEMSMAAIGASTVEQVFNALEDARQGAIYDLSRYMGCADALSFQTWEPIGSVLVQVTADIVGQNNIETLVETNLGGDCDSFEWDGLATARLVYNALRKHVEQVLRMDPNMYGTQSAKPGENMRISMRQVVAEFGINLDELAAPSVGGIGTDNPSDNHQSENDYEDPDLKLGEVEEPYSTHDGPMGTMFDDGDKYDIVKGAQALTPDELQVIQDDFAEHTERGDRPEPQDISTTNAGVRQLAIEVANSFGVDEDTIYETLHDTAYDLVWTSRRVDSKPILSYRNGPNVFTYTLVFESNDTMSDTVPVFVNCALNGTSRFEFGLTVTNYEGAQPEVIFEGSPWTNVYNDLLDTIGQNIYYFNEFIDEDMSTPPKEAVGLIEGPVIDENIHGNDFGRADQAIPRSPDMEGPLYGR